MSLLSCTKGLIIHDRKRTIIEKLWCWYWDTWIYKTYQYSWAYRLRWKITHWWRKDNWVKTNLPYNFYDRSTLMQEAMFSLVSGYVARDEEDAFAKVHYDYELSEIKEKIIQILHFYHVELPCLEENEEKMLQEIYKDSRMYFVPCKDMDGFSEMKFDYTGEYTEEEIKKMTDVYHTAEMHRYKRIEEMLKLCVEVRPYLWA